MTLGTPVAENTGAERRVSTVYLMVLTCSAFGLQGIWSLVLASGTPYLLSLGFSHTTTAIVWSVGPICGTFLQPCIAVYSDQMRTRWGRRKPLIAGGVCISVLALINISVLSFTAPLAYEFVPRKWAASISTKDLTGWLAIGWLHVLHIGVQPIQIGIRSFMIEACPTNQQHQASAWMGRFTALGAMCTYLIDLFVLKKHPDLNFNAVCAISGFNLVLFVLPSIVLIREEKEPGNGKTFKITELFGTIKKTACGMSKTTKHICIVQFASWFAWFPFLYYNTTYVTDVAGSESQVVGVRAFLSFSVVTLVSAIIMPWFQSSDDPLSPRWLRNERSCIRRAHLSCRTLWFVSQLIFAGCMLSTVFISTTTAATVIVAVSGISWSLSLWVPLAMISMETAKVRAQAKDGDLAEAPAENQTAVLLSIYNAAISLPQILAALVCGAMFMMIERGQDIAPVAWVLVMGGVVSIFGAGLIVLLKP